MVFIDVTECVTDKLINSPTLHLDYIMQQKYVLYKFQYWLTFYL